MVPLDAGTRRLRTRSLQTGIRGIHNTEIMHDLRSDVRYQSKRYCRQSLAADPDTQRRRANTHWTSRPVGTNTGQPDSLRMRRIGSFALRPNGSDELIGITSCSWSAPALASEPVPEPRSALCWSAMTGWRKPSATCSQADKHLQVPEKSVNRDDALSVSRGLNNNLGFPVDCTPATIAVNYQDRWPLRFIHGDDNH